MNHSDCDDTDIHFSTSWVLEQIALHTSRYAADCAFIPRIVVNVGPKHRKACFDAFSLAKMMGEVELSTDPIGSVGTFDAGLIIFTKDLFQHCDLTNSKGNYLLWAARIEVQQQQRQA